MVPSIIYLLVLFVQDLQFTTAYKVKKTTYIAPEYLIRNL